MTPLPKPASAAIVRRGNTFLLVLRRNPPSADMYAFPGGRAEPGESPEDAALRELAEETGIVAANPKLFATFDLKHEADERAPASHFFLSVFTVDADETSVATAADDAANVGWYTLEQIRALPAPESVLECVQRLSTEE